ncbi:phage tail protein, partial [Pseudomonas sp. MF7451]|uniref:phage tail protein n=1 Tax=Pseudomonas sp. MF7451 TaxID=2797538 RepID=UPI0018E793A5|nr:phage tail protein [Pseudomonas sp. MF7451]
MGASITLAGESLIAQKQGAQQPLIVSRFVLANVPGLNPNGPVDRAAPKPVAHLVASYDVTQKGFVNPNQVVYSLMMGSDIGDFDWNWIGLETAENVLLAVAYVPVQQKRKHIPPQQVGNNVTRNFLVVFDGAQALTGITVDASTWQHDFTVRLHGIDERERLSNRDIYGRACFFGSAFQVEKVGSDYRLKPGMAYVEGIRLVLPEFFPVAVPRLPSAVYLIVSLRRELSDVVASWTLGYEANQADYTDSSGTRHYCIALADLTPSQISDYRTAEPINSPLISHFAARTGDYPQLRARATTKCDVGLSNVPNAISDDYATDNSLIIATTKAVNSVRRLLLQAIDKIISGDTPAGKAKRLETARTLSISGAGTGEAQFDGGDNANILLTLADSGVKAGTYPKVQVNAKGIVVGAQALTAQDIPGLDWSKITSGKPNTLNGYGITDA